MDAMPSYRNMGLAGMLLIMRLHRRMASTIKCTVCWNELAGLSGSILCSPEEEYNTKKTKSHEEKAQYCQVDIEMLYKTTNGYDQDVSRQKYRNGLAVAKTKIQQIMMKVGTVS